MGDQEGNALGGGNNDRVCAGHKYFERKIDDIAKAVEKGFREVNEKVEKGFREVNDKVDTVRLHNAALESSVKRVWYDVNDQKQKLEAIPDKISDAINKHSEGCAIGDITEVGIKTHGPRRSDTPPKGTRRPANLDKLPRWAIAIGVGVVLAAVLVGLFAGVFYSTGSVDAASDTVRKVIGQDTTESNDTGKDPLKAVGAVLTGG